MPASTEEERSRTLEIEEPSTPATPAPDVAERLKLAGNKRPAVRGEFGLVVGASSRDARLECTVAV